MTIEKELLNLYEDEILKLKDLYGALFSYRDALVFLFFDHNLDIKYFIIPFIGFDDQVAEKILKKNKFTDAKIFYRLLEGDCLLIDYENQNKQFFCKRGQITHIFDNGKEIASFNSKRLVIDGLEYPIKSIRTYKLGVEYQKLSEFI